MRMIGRSIDVASDHHFQQERSLQEECSQQAGRNCGMHVIANAIATLREEVVPSRVYGDIKRFKYAHLITQEW